MFELIDDETLLIHCKREVLLEKSATAKVLEYLTVIDTRRLWVQRGYSSLYDFCIRYLGYSESEAHRRIQAARLTKRVEEVKPLLRDGSLSLTNLSLLAPLLTQANAEEILPQVIGKSTKEVEKVLNEHFPERKQKKEMMLIEMTPELKALWEEGKKLASEKKPEAVLTKLLKSYLREKTPRKRETLKHTRYVQVGLSREVKEAAGYQCEYTYNGVRCNQTAHIQVDHIRLWALGGSSKERANLRALCRLHNLYLAKAHFPAPQIKQKKIESEKKAPSYLTLKYQLEAEGKAGKCIQTKTSS